MAPRYKHLLLWQSAFLASVGIATAILLAGASLLYDYGERTKSLYSTKLGELSLQFAMIVLLGALAKVTIEWGAAQRSRYEKRFEEQREFLKRVRAVHVTVRSACDLMNAHSSAKTWGEQSRRLMALGPEIEEICEDLKVANSLFPKQGEIVNALAKIITYLAAGKDEYVRCHEGIDEDYKLKKSLKVSIAERKMEWTEDFMNNGPRYQAQYHASLTKSKGEMRQKVFRDQ